MNEGNNIYSAMFFPSEVFDLIICYSDDLIALKYFMRELREFTVIPWNMTFLKTIDNQISNRNIRYINRLRRSEIYVELTNMVLKLMDIDLLNDAYYDVLVYYDRNADKLDPGQSYQELDVWHDYEWIYNGEVLVRRLDDGTFSLLNSFAQMNQYEIVSYIQENEEFLKNLFSIWTDQNKSEESKNDVVLLLRGYCSIAKGLQFAHRTPFYRSLCHHGLFTIFSSSLNNSQLAIRIAATAVLSNVLEHDPSLVRSYTLAQIRQSQPNLIFQVIERLHDEPDAGVRSQYSEILRILIDGPKNDGVIEVISK
ncbi:Platinum sensitivity protein [Lobulomyces angularis]|nr:Platinum sensitivity protein [Lobulomyces angularis]